MSIGLNIAADLDRARRAASLENWLTRSRENFSAPHRYPEIDFDANAWPIRSKHKTRLADFNFDAVFNALEKLDKTYTQAVRCFASEEAILDNKKDLKRLFQAWRWVAHCAPQCLLDLRASHFKALEARIVKECIGGASAADGQSKLDQLVLNAGQLARLGVIEPISWSVSHDTRKKLRELEVERRRAFRKKKVDVLDRQIEALSDAMRAMFRGDARLSPFDRAVLAAMGIMMTAPSRVNEPMCMSIDDVFKLEDYAVRPESLEAMTELGRAHSILLQKGSKGASWSAKPALNFMVALLEECMKVLIEGGKRSRKLATWYEENPDVLYLPPELEHLRGKTLERQTVWQIVNLTNKTPNASERNDANPIFNELKEAGKVRVVLTSRLNKSGYKSSRNTLQIVDWKDLEHVLLCRVRAALETCRRVTNDNNYEGRLSNMLMLFDSELTPYLPRAVKYASLRRRLKLTSEYADYTRKRGGSLAEPTIFQKLDLTMVVGNTIEDAFIETHDPRRWLTTKALEAKDKLSNVVINKFANRLCIEHLGKYDFRSDFKKADQAAMPTAAPELTDISAGLQQIEGLEAAYGLGTEIVTVGDAGISMTSMDSIATATKGRPLARTSNQIIILYATPFGACVHQHHETPCRSYVCLPCNESLVVKGHLPTNEEIRKRNALLFRSIVVQLDRLVTTHDRGIADLPEGLEDHMVTLVQKGLTAEQMAETLISQFHEIKDRIKSPCLKNRLEEAFVARGTVERLDSPDVASGALIRYHNPGRHASPGHERALDAHGGRENLDARLEAFHRANPQFAPTSLGLKDERELLERETGDDDE